MTANNAPADTAIAGARSPAPGPAGRPYAARAAAADAATGSSLANCPVAARLLRLMDAKRTNLCVAADVTTKADLLRIAETVGPHICVLKTHIDIVEDFDRDLVDRLAELADRHDFLIFEDRKFADIGNTVHLQYTKGPFQIARWAHITNAHAVPGDGILRGLAQAGEPLGRGLLVLAEMSSAGTLAAGAYSAAAVEMARRHRPFVFGFIAMKRYDPPASDPDEDWVYMTPGVGIPAAVAGDALGQQYRSPRDVVLGSGCDVIIVGRAVYAGAADNAEVAARAAEFRRLGWEAYLERTGQA
ncbi:orotidine 5'-phosphate decarboxylase [Cladochytrium tenue]|nr:orotidine 5'-phosphate decarboxylase [Cladochytrium tenue]